MRHETCLNCQTGVAAGRNVIALVVVAESVAGDRMHHHHTTKCDGCGRWWFDDISFNGLGIPVANRRDTEMCGCPDGLPQYASAAVQVPVPDEECVCTKAAVERHSLPIRLRSTS
jgi:hypothetical protein